MTYQTKPIFWSFRRCPYAMRARLAVKSSGIKVDLREILLRDKPEEFLLASQKGTVPVLEVGDGQVIDESLDVMFWALSQSDPEGWLDIYHRDKAAVEEHLSSLDTKFKFHLDRYKYATRYDDVDENLIVWNSSVIARDYVPDAKSVDGNKVPTHFKDFVRNICSDEFDDDGNALVDQKD